MQVLLNNNSNDLQTNLFEHIEINNDISELKYINELKSLNMSSNDILYNLNHVRSLETLKMKQKKMIEDIASQQMIYEFEQRELNGEISVNYYSQIN